ncbi:YvrJ family protein [Clostridium tetani]|uniref:YvrJ family protein n=1 Tax=Clostridium tetani TaxID=1513 RepID=UPI00100BBA9F|nr:YvrJ family protein [Clostridium tetani]RXM73679.1 YvrJ family protein [Clostridium tetani]RYU97835.1 YvrJ family protein [Clostridium tetani]
MFDEILMLISNVGFPVAISIYLLVRIEDRLSNLTNSFNKLSKTIEISIEHQRNKNT